MTGTCRTQTLPWWLGREGVKTTENKIYWARCSTVYELEELEVSVHIFLALLYLGQCLLIHSEAVTALGKANAYAKFVSETRQNCQNGAGSNQLKEVGKG